MSSQVAFVKRERSSFQFSDLTLTTPGYMHLLIYLTAFTDY